MNRRDGVLTAGYVVKLENQKKYAARGYLP